MSTSPQADYKKEVRFAVVMYGGVSLAIYINGVTQELFRLVRSTAKCGPQSQNGTALSGSSDSPAEYRLTGTERVYRMLSHLLSDEGLLRECQQAADKAEKTPDEAIAFRDKLEALAEDNRNVETGFIVDILSGTSAGGINSIYLAKALANNQRIDRLKQLWIDEGDIELLLNDSRSIKGLTLDPQDPPQSLLNSRRMYLKLLKALDDMDRDDPNGKDGKGGKPSQYTKELDLFITATDIEGVPVPLKLTDKIVYERRHRNVFHFEYQNAEDNHDFSDTANPFLAFAARCTSSFPFAFEPMRLCDIDEVLQLLPNYRGKPEYKSESGTWRKYFREILDPRTGAPNLRFTHRSFGDGGYLDNKPFSYAIEALVRRQSDVPVDRKLIYIEPSPDHPEDVPERNLKIDALANVKTALLDLPTYETIREDLQKILQRNLLIERVQRIISAIEKDVNAQLPDQFKSKLTDFQDAVARGEDLRPKVLENDLPMWSQKNLTAMVQEKGRSFLSYRKLRISAVTDEVARLLARLLNIDANSDFLLPLRCLVRAWRDANYFDDKSPSLNQFLSDFDFSHRIRRLTFIREKIDRLYDFSWSTRQELMEYGQKYRELEPLLNKLDQEQQKIFRSQNADIGWLLGLLRSSGRLAQLEDGQREELREALIFMKCEVNQVYKELQSKARLLRQRRLQANQAENVKAVPDAKRVENPLLEPIENIGITTDLLQQIIDPDNLRMLLEKQERNPTSSGAVNEDDCFLVAEDFMKKHSGDNDFAGKIKKAADKLQSELKDAIEHARHRIGVLFDPNKTIEAESERGQNYLNQLHDQIAWLGSPTVKGVREYLAYYYYNFEEYDQISFPIFYEAEVGEASTVDVIRVSPEDATSLIDEREEARNSPSGKGRQKLAGVSLHHFGAFLDRTWRQNDIMWGRLDGFERLITTLLPGDQNKNLRRFLIDEGNTSILIDELPPESRLQLGGIVSEALVRASAGEPIEAAVTKVTRGLKDNSPVRTRLEAVVRSSLNNQELMDFIKSGYEVNRKLDPKPLLTSISRSTQIIGKVFEDVANANQLDGKSLAWIARLGQVFWGLVEVAVPNTLRNMLWNRWLSIIYAFEFFIIVAGLLLSSQGAQQFGWTAFGITAALNVIVLVLKDIMRGRHAVYRASVVFVCLLILSLAALGLLEVLGPVFGVTWGSQHLHPMYWLKETARHWINALPYQWLRDNLVNVVLLSTVAGVLVLLNVFFGLVDFSWLDARWKFLWLWLKRCKLKAIIPWARFKPIRILADDVHKKVRPFPGKPSVFLVPLALSSSPSSLWIHQFETSFKNQQNGKPPSQQAAIEEQQLVVVSSENELEFITDRLEKAVAEANAFSQRQLEQQATDDFENHRRMMKSMSQAQTADGNALPDSIREHLESLRAAASRKLGSWTIRTSQVIGVLLLVMSIGILFTLISNEIKFSKYPSASLPDGLHNPGIAIQLAHNPQEATRAIQTQGILNGALASDSGAANFAGKNALRNNILVDWVVIFYYTIALGLLSFWLSRQCRPTERSFLNGAIAFVLLTAIFDILENNRILTLLGQEPIGDSEVNNVWMAATWKWAMLFAVLALIGRHLWARKYSLLKWNGLALLITVIIGAIGLIGFRVAVEIAFWFMALSLLPLAATLLLQPRRLARK